MRGSGNERIRDIAIGSNSIYVGGFSDSNWNTPIKEYTGNIDGFITKISEP